MQIQTKQGSATSPRPVGDKGVIVAHIVNQLGAWGAGFVLAVDELSPAPKTAYKALAKQYNNTIPLGTIQFVEVSENLWVANMVAQTGIDRTQSTCLVDYAALTTCLAKVFRRSILLKCDVHIPAGMGSGLAGGDKQTIHGIIVSEAMTNPIQMLEQRQMFGPQLVLWEFDDQSAASYVATMPADDPASKKLPDADSGSLDLDGIEL